MPATSTTDSHASGSNSTSSTSPMPVWLDDCHIDPAWLRDKLPRASSSASSLSSCDNHYTVTDISNQGRKGATVREGATLLLTWNSNDDDHHHQSFVLKQQLPSAFSKQLGLAREALFYKHLLQLPQLSNASIPKIYYSHGNMSTGEKCILMEKIEGIDSGILFGPGNPNNWLRDLPQLLKAAYPLANTGGGAVPTSAAVAKETFCAAAKIHAFFWKDASLLELDWLRGSGWLQGKSQESWVASQAYVQDIWAKHNDEKNDETCIIEWDPLVHAVTSKAMAGISWDAQVQRLHTKTRWTLVHGDFWPGNVMLDHRCGSSSDCSSSNKLSLLDWEMVGLGSGPQDLGQYVLSNMDPAERRACEKELVRAYCDELIRGGVNDTTDDDEHQSSLWDYCWTEYKVGGVERWLWFLVYFLGQKDMKEWAQFFHNQIAAFLHDHELTANDICQPRP